MKKLLTALTFCLALATALPTQVLANDPSNKIESTTPAKGDEARINQLTTRLHEIKEMDRSEMTRAEKKELRKEVKEIKKEMKAMKGGVYLSVSAIIIILLILILVL